MPELNHFPDSNLFLPDKNFEINKTYIPNKVKQFSVELWQILTGITIVLTLASFLIYFSDLRPKTTETSYVNLGQLKTSLFNHQNQLHNWYEENYKEGNAAITLKESCYNDIAAVETNEEFYAGIEKDLVDYDQKFSVLTSDYKTNETSDLFKQSEINSYMVSVERYQTFLKSYFQRQKIFYGEILTLKKSASKVCKSKASESDKNLQELKTTIDNFPSETLLDYTTLNDDSNSFYSVSEELFKKIKTKSFNRESDLSVVDQFKDKLIAVFKASFNFDAENIQMTELLGQSDKEVIKLEAWEKEFIDKNDHLSKFLVLMKKSE